MQYKSFFFCSPPLNASTSVSVYNRGGSGGRFNKCVVLSELKKACYRGWDSIWASRDHCRLIQLALLHPRTSISSLLFFPSPCVPPPSSHSSSCWPSITDLGALRVIFIPSAGDVTSEADTNSSYIHSYQTLI